MEQFLQKGCEEALKPLGEGNGLCGCSPAVGTGRSRSFLPTEKSIFSEYCAALHFFKGNFQDFCLRRNQMHISCKPPDFVGSPRKQLSLFIFFRIRLFFPLFPCHLWHQAPLRGSSLPKASALPCPEATDRDLKNCLEDFSVLGQTFISPTSLSGN